jgi:hypothetical protein
MQFLAKADPTISSKLDELAGKDVSNPNIQAKVDQIMQLVGQDLGKMYPGASITMKPFSESLVDLPIIGTLMTPTINFNGTDYHIFNDTMMEEGKFPGKFGVNSLIWQSDETSSFPF